MEQNSELPKTKVNLTPPTFGAKLTLNKPPMFRILPIALLRLSATATPLGSRAPRVIAWPHILLSGKKSPMSRKYRWLRPGRKKQTPISNASECLWRSRPSITLTKIEALTPFSNLTPLSPFLGFSHLTRTRREDEMPSRNFAVITVGSLLTPFLFAITCSFLFCSLLKTKFKTQPTVLLSRSGFIVKLYLEIPPRV